MMDEAEDLTMRLLMAGDLVLHSTRLDVALKLFCCQLEMGFNERCIIRLCGDDRMITWMLWMKSSPDT